MSTRTVLFAFGVGLMALAGCADTGEVVTLNIRTMSPATQAVAKTPDGLRVIVAAFEDARPGMKRLGFYSYRWESQTHYFDVPGGNHGEAVASFIAEYLNQKGWRAELAKAGDVSTGGIADVIVTGKLLDMSVNANSRVFWTNITATTKLAIQARNTGDDSIVRTTLSGEGSQSVFWFDTEDAERLIDDILTDSLEKLLTTTKVENNLLRLK